MFSHKKVGGLTFVRVWRLSFSYCITKKAPRASVAKSSPCLRSVMIDGRRAFAFA